MLTSYADVVALSTGLVLPAIVALFTKKSTSPTVKGIAHAVLSLATGFAAIYQSNPQHLDWAPAVIAAFLSWFSGTAVYHSLLKKYAWFGWLQTALVHDTKTSVVDAKTPVVDDYLEEAEAALEAPAVNNFPLSTDLIAGAAKEIAQVPVIHDIVQTVESVVQPAPSRIPGQV